MERRGVRIDEVGLKEKREKKGEKVDMKKRKKKE